MMKRLLIYASILVIVFAVAACGKKEEKRRKLRHRFLLNRGRKVCTQGTGCRVLEW